MADTPSGPSEPIFIGGLQRSGTTILGRLVARHPAVTGIVGTPTQQDEGQFVQDVYLDDHEMGLRRGSTIGRSVRWAYHPQAHLTEFDARRQPGAAERLLECWSPFWERPDALHFVEKSPSNIVRTRYLQELFPNARFVIVTRHPVAQGLAVRKWATRRQQVGLDFGGVIAHWLYVMELFRDDLPSLGAVHVCSYEQLVADPATTLRGIVDFLGVAQAEIDTSDVERASQRYAAYWDQMRSPGVHMRAFSPVYPVKSRKSRLLRAAERIVVPASGRLSAARIADQYGERIRAFGYELDDLTRIPHEWS